MFKHDSVINQKSTSTFYRRHIKLKPWKYLFLNINTVDKTKNSIPWEIWIRNNNIIELSQEGDNDIMWVSLGGDVDI